MSTRSTARTRPAFDPGEVERFDRLAGDWWNPDGPMRPLHRINPLRLAFVRDEATAALGRDPGRPFPLAELSVLDVGCGAGLLSEPLARMGAAVTGLDPAGAALDAARAHAAEAGLAIDYRSEAVEEVAAAGTTFDLVVAMEVVEHVPDVPAFVRACAACVRPGGLLLLSTINRTLRAHALAIVAAEYVLRWLPRGTHDWDRFVTPAELRRATEAAGLSGFGTRGMVYSPLTGTWSASRDTAVNYLARAARPATP